MRQRDEGWLYDDMLTRSLDWETNSDSIMNGFALSVEEFRTI